MAKVDVAGKTGHQLLVDRLNDNNARFFQNQQLPPFQYDEIEVLFSEHITPSDPGWQDTRTVIRCKREDVKDVIELFYDRADISNFFVASDIKVTLPFDFNTDLLNNTPSLRIARLPIATACGLVLTNEQIPDVPITDPALISLNTPWVTHFDIIGITSPVWYGRVNLTITKERLNLANIANFQMTEFVVALDTDRSDPYFKQTNQLGRPSHASLTPRGAFGKLISDNNNSYRNLEALNPTYLKWDANSQPSILDPEVTPFKNSRVRLKALTDAEMGGVNPFYTGEQTFYYNRVNINAYLLTHRQKVFARMPCRKTDVLEQINSAYGIQLEPHDIVDDADILYLGDYSLIMSSANMLWTGRVDVSIDTIFDGGLARALPNTTLRGLTAPTKA